MKKTLAVLLAAMLLAGMLAGCGGDSAIVGSWEATVDMADQINQQFAAEGMSDYINLDSFGIVLCFTFDKDGTYTCSADEDALVQSLEDMKDVMRGGLTKYAEDMITQSGMTDISVDDVFEAAGTSLDELLDEMYSEDDLKDRVDGFAAEGNYKTKDGKLYLSDGLDHIPDDEVYYTYTIEGDTMTFLEGVGDEEGMAAGLFPMELKKVG